MVVEVVVAMTPDEVVARALAVPASPPDLRSLAELGLDSLDALEVLAALAEACPGLRLGDERPTADLTPAHLGALVAAYRNLGADSMAISVEVP